MKTFSLFCLLIVQFCFAQTYKITYQSSFEGKVNPNQDPTIVYVDSQQNIITSEKISQNKKEFPYEITSINTLNWETTYFGFLKNQEQTSTKNSNSIGSYTYKTSDETKKILGYTCKKMTTSVNSNTIDIWYTTDLKVFGGPSLLGVQKGLVLETVRNGNSKLTAISVQKTKDNPAKIALNKLNSASTDELSYRDRIWKSRYTTIPIFKNQTINFSDTAKSKADVLRYANGTIVLKKIKFPKIDANQGVFIELKEQSKGDAYDRTGTVFMIPEEGKLSFLNALKDGIKTMPHFTNESGKIFYGNTITPNYFPPIELMRFFTPFGVKQFNHIQLKGKTWTEQTPYRQDITELTPNFSNKEVWIGVFIGNYDKGGHQIDLEATIHQDGLIAFPSDEQIPLFNTLNIMEMAGQDYATMFSSPEGLVVDFELKNDLKNATLRYISTGHGGWENGDEFVPKSNAIVLDKKEIFQFTPWRTDCGSYRLHNPASGNFGNGLSSSDLSRSNWCPGTTTNPAYISLGDLKAGKHQIQIKIPQGKNEGSSFSSWNVSGLLLGKKENLPE